MSADEMQEQAMRGVGEARRQVTITNPAGDRDRLDPDDAAKALVDYYGARAVDQEITGLRPSFEATWEEVDRLLLPAETFLRESRRATGYDDEADCGVDALVDYKNLLEERLYDVLNGDVVALQKVAGLVPLEDEWGSAAGSLEALAGILDRHGIERPAHYDGESPR